MLLVEDDVNLTYIIKSILESVIGGYEICVGLNGAEGLEHLKSFTPDIVVSDIEMPVMNGLEMVKKIRETNLNVPIVFTTGKIAPQDVTAGYDVGADNYIKKPFTPEELDAHVKTIINLKNNSRLQVKNAIYQIGKYTFEPKKLSLIYPDSGKIELTARESQILEMLVQRKGEIINRDEILKMFWDNADPYFASRSLDVFISKLRKYLSKDETISIKNVKPVGLILDF